MYLFFNSTVQHECIPQAVLGMDILGQAKSGMGKTAVFVLATLQQIDPVDGQVSCSQQSNIISLFIILSLVTSLVTYLSPSQVKVTKLTTVIYRYSFVSYRCLC